MKILKAFLYLILSMCLLWAFILLLGPRILALSLEVAYDEKIVVNDITFTPRLGLKLRGVEYNGLVLPEFGEVYGFSKSINIQTVDWLKLDPKLIIVPSVTKINNHLEIDNLYLKISFSEFLDFSTLEFSGTLNNIYSDFLGMAQDFSLSGRFSSETAIFDSLVFKASKVHLKSGHSPEPDFLMVSMSGSLDLWNLNRPVKSQKAVIELRSKKILLGSEHISLDNLLINSDLDNNGVIVKLFADNLNYAGEYMASELVSKFLIPDYEINNNAVLEFGIKSPNFLILKKYIMEGSIQAISGKVFSSKIGQYTLEAEMETDLLKLQNDGIFIADLSGSQVFVVADFMEQGNPRIAVDLNVSIPQNVKVESSNAIQLEAPSLSTCFSSKCLVSNLQSDYTVKIGEADLFGKLICPKGDCGREGSVHLIKTSHTNRFFESLLRSNKLNPLITASIYSQISAGIKIGDGHQINF